MKNTSSEFRKKRCSRQTTAKQPTDDGEGGKENTHKANAPHNGSRMACGTGTSAMLQSPLTTLGLQIQDMSASVHVCASSWADGVRIRVVIRRGPSERKTIWQ